MAEKACIMGDIMGYQTLNWFILWELVTNMMGLMGFSGNFTDFWG